MDLRRYAECSTISMLERDLSKSRLSLCSSVDKVKYNEEMFADSFLSLRKVTIDWYESIASHYHLSRRTMALAVTYFDRYCNYDETCRCDKVGNLMRLSGIVCLILATKMDNTRPIPIGTIPHLSCYTFEEKHGRLAEHCILRGLKFNLTPPLSCDIVEGLTACILFPIITKQPSPNSQSSLNDQRNHLTPSDSPQCRYTSLLRTIHENALSYCHMSQRDRISLDFQPHILAIASIFKASRPHMSNGSFESLRVACKGLNDTKDQWDLIVQCCNDLDNYIEEVLEKNDEDSEEGEGYQSDDESSTSSPSRRHNSPTSVAELNVLNMKRESSEIEAEVSLPKKLRRVS